MTYLMTDPRIKHRRLHRPVRGLGWSRGPSRGRSNGLWSCWRVNVVDSVGWWSHTRRNRFIEVYMTYNIILLYSGSNSREEKVKKFHHVSYYILISVRRRGQIWISPYPRGRVMRYKHRTLGKTSIVVAVSVWSDSITCKLHSLETGNQTSLVEHVCSPWIVVYIISGVCNMQLLVCLIV